MKRLRKGHIPSPREFRREMEKRGWKHKTGGKHEHLEWKTGHKINIPCSHSDVRGIKNLLRLAARIEEGRV